MKWHGDPWVDFVSTHSPKDVAMQLLNDSDRLKEGRFPSTLAHYLPKVSTKEAADIGAFLATPATDLHPSIARLLYENIRARLLFWLNWEPNMRHYIPRDGYRLVSEMDAGDRRDGKPPHNSVDQKKEVKDDIEAADIDATLRVLARLKLNKPTAAPQIDGVVALVQEGFPRDPAEHQNWSHHVNTYNQQRPPLRQRHCYVCHYELRETHQSYKAMCRPCGNFNLAGLHLTSPSSLKLSGRTALVTGARVNLGYHVALRLLRCGAMVIASTRYPNDAATRYAGEADFALWKGRLQIVGADLRSAKDAFSLVHATREAIRRWRVASLDVLINNAAQTLTDSVKKEERSVSNEQSQAEAARDTGLVYHAESLPAYQPRIRGGVAPLALFDAPEQALDDGVTKADNELLLLPDGVKDDGRTELEPYFKSSWVQTLTEIPFEDVVSAHAVNSFVPLLLCRELLPLMGLASSDRGTEQPNRPRGYIINVSSREGLFESTPEHAAKSGHHVHTNMSKAALNMITQTEATAAWRLRRVAMNTVDPGYMSAAPEKDALFGGERPIGWEDGAGRVLWPVAIGEVEGDAVWGRFLKHYGATHVDFELNRG